jgi:UDP-glucose 4-epimerase
MKILITGALGHIGSRLLRDIPKLQPCVEIIMIDNMMTQRYSSLFDLPEGGTYHFIEDDILTADIWAVMNGVNVVIHLAAVTDAANSFRNKEQVEHVNYNATARVAEACCTAGIPMIHISSTSVYGTQKELVDETCSHDELQPQSPYAETKLKEENLLRNLGLSKGLRFISCRFGTIAGTSTGMRFHTAVNKFCWQAVMGQPLTVWRTAMHQKRPYLSLDDAVRALMFIIDRELFDNRVYNVLTENLTVHDIVESIKQRAPELLVGFVDAQIMNQLSYEVSNKRFKDKGFNFTGSIDRCIADTIRLIGKAGGNRVR